MQWKFYRKIKKQKPYLEEKIPVPDTVLGPEAWEYLVLWDLGMKKQVIKVGLDILMKKYQEIYHAMYGPIHYVGSVVQVQ